MFRIALTSAIVKNSDCFLSFILQYLTFCFCVKPLQSNLENVRVSWYDEFADSFSLSGGFLAVVQDVAAFCTTFLRRGISTTITLYQIF